jgi:hybrid cluster-associated redox disulfide protein
VPLPTRASPTDLDLTIRDYLTRRPHAVGVLLDLRMGCLGCEFSAFDTLRQALTAHGIPLFQYIDHLGRASPPGVGELPPPSFAGDDR